jgi:ADP-heptose:LPS heptosyltransferase
MRDYAFRKRHLRRLAGAVDAVGDRLVRRRRPAPPTAPAKLLVIRLDHLGDVLFATPALRALREAFPAAHITLLAGPWTAAVANQHVDAVYEADVPWFARPRRAGGAGTWWSVLRWIRAQRFDTAIDLRGDFRHALWLWAARVPVRIGSGATGGGWLLTHEVTSRAVHEVERNLDMVRVLSPSARSGALVPVTSAPQSAAAVLLSEVGVGAQQPILLVHAGAGYATKLWEPEKLAACLDALQGSGLAPVFVGTGADRAATDAVRARTRIPVGDLTGRTSLPELAALCARATAFLGGDSGPAHVAVAAGLPCVLVYSGVNDVARWGPWGGTVRVLHHPVHCSPCGLAVCAYDHECMRGIPPQAARDALLELVAAAR